MRANCFGKEKQMGICVYVLIKNGFNLAIKREQWMLPNDEVVIQLMSDLLKKKAIAWNSDDSQGKTFSQVKLL